MEMLEHIFTEQIVANKVLNIYLIVTSFSSRGKWDETDTRANRPVSNFINMAPYERNLPTSREIISYVPNL